MMDTTVKSCISFLLVDVFGISDESLVDESHKLQIVQIVLSGSVQ